MPSVATDRRMQSKVKPWPPRWLTSVPAADIKRGDGDHCVQWMETFCRITEDSVGGPRGQLLVIRPWQRTMIGHLLARRPDRKLRHRQGLIGVGRKNTKSTISAGLGLYGLLSDYPGGAQGREVYSCAGDKDQAGIVFEKAKTMIEMDPDLAGITTPYRDAIEVPATGSVYRVLSAEAYTKEGLNPTFVVFDEVHVQPNRGLWDVMANAMGARPEPLMVGITTAGVRVDNVGKDTLCYQLYQYGQKIVTGEVDDPDFFFCWWEPPTLDNDELMDHTDPLTWAYANPGLGDLVSLEDLRSASKKTPEAEFRTKRCNQWVMTAASWLPSGSWAACTQSHPIPDGARVVVGFDGSYDNDSTALVVVQVPDPPGADPPAVRYPHLEVGAAWERVDSDNSGWRVPIVDVEDAIRACCTRLPQNIDDFPDAKQKLLRGLAGRRWQVVEIACDPARWARTYELLEAEGLPVVEYPQSPQRMTPATQRFFEAVVNKTITHTADPRMARHLDNAVLKVDSRGSRLSKGDRGHQSQHHIDLAVSGVMAHDRACWHQNAAPPAGNFFAARR